VIEVAKEKLIPKIKEEEEPSSKENEEERKGPKTKKSKGSRQSMIIVPAEITPDLKKAMA
jgi:hypothetical protein